MGQMKIPSKKNCDSCQKLLTADENENQPRELNFGTGMNFRGLMKIPLKKNVTAVNCCQKPLNADENKNKSRELKFGTGTSFRG